MSVFLICVIISAVIRLVKQQAKIATCVGPARPYMHLSNIHGGFCRQALCQVLTWAWAMMELAVSLGALVFPWVGSHQSNAYITGLHAWLCMASAAGKRCWEPLQAFQKALSLT